MNVCALLSSYLDWERRIDNVLIKKLLLNCDSEVAAIVKMDRTIGYLNSVEEGPELITNALAPLGLYSSHSTILNRPSDAFSTESISLL